LLVNGTAGLPPIIYPYTIMFLAINYFGLLSSIIIKLPKTVKKFKAGGLTSRTKFHAASTVTF